MLLGRDVTIIGAGIGGLAAAIALAQRGAQVRVLEQAASLAEVGAGLQISPNGMHVLRALGLETECLSASLRGHAVNLLDYRRGARVLRLDLAGLRPGQRYQFIHRADLLRILDAAARETGVAILPASRVSTVKVDTDGTVTLRIDGQNPERCDLVIGADGLKSVARGAIGAAPAASFTGQVAWRALVPLQEPVAPEVRVYMGPGRHLVAYPLRDAQLLNIVAVQERHGWAEEGWVHRDNPANLAQAFAGFAPEVRSILADMHETHLWGLFHHPVAQHWHRGGLALLGDASHPTLPFMAQGANMALEDAWVLADALACTDSTEAGLALYQARRRARVVRIVEAANGNARAYHLRNPALRFAAHTALRAGGRLFPSAALKRFDWLYGHDVTADQSSGL